MHVDDTIAAIASAAGGAARGIVRISGPQALPIALEGFTPRDADAPLTIHAPTAVAGALRLAQLHSLLPVLLYCWPGKRSYTRQPMVEIHAPGSPPLVDALLKHILARGARLAEPGEFTLRAFLAGRLDLTQAEAVLGLIDARHDGQFESALEQLAGGLSRPLHALREDLLQLLAHLEAGLDFATEDIEFISRQELESRLCEAHRHVGAVAEQMQARCAADEIPRVVLYGWPNVGKSSLLNALAGRDYALVSPQAGTTRDYLTADLSLDGRTLRLIDTAGIETADGSTIAGLGQQMRQAQQRTADLTILCLDSTRPLNDWERGELEQPAAVPRLVALTKMDIGSPVVSPNDAIATSAATGEGLDLLRQRIVELLEASPSVSAVASTAVRAGESIRQATESLASARALAASGGYEELVAAEVRSALEHLGKVVGAVYTDDLLDHIFSRFCIGK